MYVKETVVRVQLLVVRFDLSLFDYCLSQLQGTCSYTHTVCANKMFPNCNRNSIAVCTHAKCTTHVLSQHTTKCPTVLR